MQIKRMVLAIIVGFVIVGIVSRVIRSVWLIPMYSHYELIWALRAKDISNRWLLWVGQLVFIVVFISVYIRGMDNKRWVTAALRFGVMMALLMVVPAAFTQYVIYPVPYTLVLKWIIAGTLQLVALALVVAAFCTKVAPRWTRT